MVPKLRPKNWGLCDINFSISHCDMISISHCDMVSIAHCDLISISQRHRDIAFRFIAYRIACRYRNVDIAILYRYRTCNISILHLQYLDIAKFPISQNFRYRTCDMFLISQRYRDIVISHNPTKNTSENSK